MSKFAYHPASPRAALRVEPVHSSTKKRKPRMLSKAQLAIPFFSLAKKALTTISQHKESLLPRLLYKSASGRETRSEIYKAIEASAEPILSRLDVATGVLGWLDSKGTFRLNTQRGIAEDSGLSASSFNRLINAFSEAGYVQKDSEKIRVIDRENGIPLIRTRSLIRFTTLFFRHLNISAPYGRARRYSRKRRKRLLADIRLHEAQVIATQVVQQDNRIRRDKIWNERKSGDAEKTTNKLTFYELKVRSELAVKMKYENPAMSSIDIYKAIDKLII